MNKTTHRILIIDHEKHCEHIKQIFEDFNFRVDVVSDVQDAEKKMTEHQQPVVLFVYLPENAFHDWVQKSKKLYEETDTLLLYVLDKINRERFEAIREYNPYGFVLTNTEPYSLFQTLYFAIEIFEARSSSSHLKQEIEAELNTLATAFQSATGRQFFNDICKHFVESLDVDYAFIGELSGGGKIVKAHNVYGEGEFLDPFEYELSGTPCEKVSGQKLCFYSSGVQKQFPKDKILRQMGIDGYVGSPLFSSSGKPLGIFALLNKNPLKDKKRYKRYLQIYSNRVAAEMERLQSESELREREEELRSINEHILEGIYRSTPNDGLVYVNVAFAAMFGYDSPEEILSIDSPILYANDGRRQEITKIENRQGYVKNEEVEFKRKDGSSFWGLMSGKAVHDDEGNIAYYDGSVLDITERKQAEVELLASKNRKSAILSTALDAIVTIDHEGRILEFNKAAESIFGYAQKDVKGKKMGDVIVPPDMRESHEKGMERYLSSRKSKIMGKRLEMNAIRSDKMVFPVELSINRISDTEPPVFTGFIRDITERVEKEQRIKKSLREKEVLLMEIHHRVKNNLAIISGLLELESMNRQSDTQLKGILQESQLRIHSMAMIHEKLYEARNFTNLKLADYISELVDKIRNTFLKDKQSVIIDIKDHSDIELNINQAIPCALILNELVTNAFKYAYNGTGGGELSIQLKPEDDLISLTVKDNGPGLPEDIEERSKNSLGFTLVRQLTKQLQGELTIKNENGALFEIVFEKVEDASGSSSSGYIIDRK